MRNNRAESLMKLQTRTCQSGREVLERLGGKPLVGPQRLQEQTRCRLASTGVTAPGFPLQSRGGKKGLGEAQPAYL